MSQFYPSYAYEGGFPEPYRFAFHGGGVQMMPKSGMMPMGTGTGMTGQGMVPPQVNSGSMMSPTGNVAQAPPLQFEQSYIENILRLNLGKTGTFYMTYENNKEWNAKVFKGKLEAAGRDHIIISDPSGMRIVLLMVNLDYATFNEPLVYQYPGVFGNPPTTSR